jgi:hypothetical protein
MTRPRPGVSAVLSQRQADGGPETHLRSRLQVLMSLVSAQLEGNGGQRLQVLPHFFRAQGSHGMGGDGGVAPPQAGKWIWQIPAWQRDEGQDAPPSGHCLQAMRMSGQSLSAEHFCSGGGGGGGGVVAEQQANFM